MKKSPNKYYIKKIVYTIGPTTLGSRSNIKIIKRKTGFAFINLNESLPPGDNLEAIIKKTLPTTSHKSLRLIVRFDRYWAPDPGCAVDFKLK